MVRPAVEFQSSYLEGVREFQAEGLPWMLAPNIEDLNRDFATFVANEAVKLTEWTPPPHVRQSEFWAMIGQEFVGRIAIRHDLNETLRSIGGHIGYDTRPSWRGRGIASEMLKQALPLARALGIRDALLTCNDTNSASIRVIEKNGGRIEAIRPQFTGGPIKRYYRISTEHLGSVDPEPQHQRE